MTNQQKMVSEFHEKHNLPVLKSPTVPDVPVLFLRSNLIQEESAEFSVAARNKDIVGMADALGDLLYVVYGAALCLGIDLEPVFAEIHRSNMTKDSGPKDLGGKVIKGPSYEPPNIQYCIEKQFPSYGNEFKGN